MENQKIETRAEGKKREEEKNWNIANTLSSSRLEITQYKTKCKIKRKNEENRNKLIQ